jgi:hypothetical protein
MIRAAALILATLVAAAPAVAFDYHVGVSVQSQSFRLWHDASGGFYRDPSGTLFPLGNPTSVLEYPVLVSPALSLGLDGQVSGWKVESSVSVSGLGGGSFRDQDFLRGGVLFSDTYSIAAQDFGLSGELTAVAPDRFALGDRWSVRPFVRAQAEVQGITNFGLSCGSVCLATRPDNVAVIQHLAYGARLGGGGRFETTLNETDTLAVDLSALAGGFFVDDSHLLRADLGPTPNILYRNLTVSLDLGATYSKQLTPDLALKLHGGAGVDVGWGTATFAPATSAASTFNAGFDRVRLQAGLGLSGQF